MTQEIVEINKDMNSLLKRTKSPPFILESSNSTVICLTEVKPNISSQNKNYHLMTSTKIKQEPKSESKQNYEAKVKKHLELEIKTSLTNNRSNHKDLQNKCRILQKEKNFWKQSFIAAKEDFASLLSSETHENYLKLQQINKKCSKSLKVAEHINLALTRQKVQLVYEITQSKEQISKANLRILQFQKQVQQKRYEFEILKQNLLRKQIEIQHNFTSISMHRQNNNQISPLRSQIEDLKRYNGFVLPKPKTPISLSKPRSKHGRSLSNSALMKSSEVSQPQTQQISQDICNQIDRWRYNYRKLQKSLSNSNSELIVEGFRRLNNKYATLYTETEPKTKQKQKIYNQSSQFH